MKMPGAQRDQNLTPNVPGLGGMEMEDGCR
jgi:hypothetical protein